MTSSQIWNAIESWSRRVGRSAARPALLMWYVMRSSDTPRRDKVAIFASLAYLLLPIDFINAKRVPIIGWLDEVASLAILVQRMSRHITPAIEARTNDQLDRWFGTTSVADADDSASYEILP